MRPGRAQTRRRPPPIGGPRREAGGFTYLLILFGIALAGIGAATLGERVQAVVQREREVELLFRGGEIQRALETYQAREIAGERRYPPALSDLVDDRREGEPRYHLRRLYADPFTGRPDWRVLRDARGGIVGVHSSARLPAFRRLPWPSVDSVVPPAVEAVEAEGDRPRRPRVGDWRFLAAGVDIAAVVEPTPTRAFDRP